MAAAAVLTWKKSILTSATVFVLLASAHPFSLLKFDTSSSSSSSSLNVQPEGDPVVIDPAGIYIRASPLQNGGIIAGYATLEGSQKILRVSQSLDNATSWVPLGEVTRADDTKVDLDNAMPLQLPSGRILLAFRNHDRDPDYPDSYTHYRISLCYSDDGGKNWGFLSQIVERKANPGSSSAGKKNGLWEPFLRLARDGSALQCYYSSENDDDDQDNFLVVSRDGGVTWSSDNPILVSGGESTDTRDGMTGVAEVDGMGTLICVFESVHKGTFSIHRTLSHNDGLTWGERSLVYTAANGKDAGAPQVYNVGGTLVTSFMTNEALPDLPHLDGGQMKVVTSVNGAADWSSMSQGGTVTGEVGSHWPGLYTLDDRRFLALYSKAGVGAVSRVYRIV